LGFFSRKTGISQLVCLQSLKVLPASLSLSEEAKPMKSLVILCLLICALTASAQYDPNYKFEEPEPLVNIGLGLGLDYGGFGGKISAFPHKNFGVFAGVGYNLLKAGYNVGGLVRLRPGKKVCPMITAMYGYNAVIIVEGADEWNKAYYGPSFGGGIELNFSNKQNFMNFGLLIPLRPQNYRDAMDALLSNPSIEMTEALPFTISVGYHFKLH
jgi:hypothetical protein